MFIIFRFGKLVFSLFVFPPAGKISALHLDGLVGDEYFHIAREKHNLDRCRTQFKLVADMEVRWSELEAIVTQYCKP